MADADALHGPDGLSPAEPAPPSLPPAPASAPGDTESPDQGVMTLVGHLSELRSRIVRSAIAVVVGGVVGFAFGDRVIAFLKAPLPISQPLVFTGIGDPFAIRLQIALVIGVILAMPVLLYQLWAFVAPGLTPSERRAIRPWIPMALVFFVIGVSIAYVILPFAAQFLLAFTSKDLQPLLTAKEYFGFVTTLFLAFGILMEFPILLVGLSRVGIVTSARLSRSRRFIILGIAIFATAVTPGGDLVSPTVLGLTMYVLFELSIILIRRSGR